MKILFDTSIFTAFYSFFMVLLLRSPFYVEPPDKLAEVSYKDVI